MTFHVPILLKPITEALIEPLRALPGNAPAHAIVDCTLGGGGHTSALLAALSDSSALSRHRILAIDQDEEALKRARERFAPEIAEGRLQLFHARFSELDRIVGQAGLPVLGILADLGFSSDQLEDPGRGISFQREGPLDMRLDPSRGRSAYEFLSKTTEKELEQVLGELGEERFARRIAQAIIHARRERRLPDATTALAEIITRAVPPPARHGRIHAATRTFQALRIHVNEELKELDRLLSHVMILLKPGGRVAILSFHSLEDRRVKLALREEPFRALTRKPLEADEDEIAVNPRARSAKLRIAEIVSGGPS